MTLILTILAALLLVIDWRQTLWIFANRWRELNPVIRWLHARFGRAGIHAYFAAWVAAVIASSLHPWGVCFAGAVAAVQAVVIVRNHMRGIRPF
jgi:hypothetical protein